MSTKRETNVFGDKMRLKKMLMSLGFSQSKLATKLNVSRQRVNNIVAGRNSFTEEQQKILCKEFNVNLNWLIADVGEMFISSEKSIKDADFDDKVKSKVTEILNEYGLTK